MAGISPGLPRNVIALTNAAYTGDPEALRAVPEPYVAPLGPSASTPAADLRTAFARKFGDAYAFIAKTEGVTLEQFLQVAGATSPQ